MGEKLIWLDLASHLGMSLQRCMSETTSTEFCLWKKYLHQKQNDSDKLDYYLAMIAKEIRISWITDKQNVSIDDFILQFKKQPITNEDEEQDLFEEQEAIRKASEASRAKWASILGIKR